jgi:ATP diphosphatase
VKAAERQAKGVGGTLDGVALGLPALQRAEKIQKRAARVGFDWLDAAGPRDKIDEELHEVETAASDDEREDEVGDLLFAVVNWSRHLKVDPEAALRRATAKFERRFRAMEQMTNALDRLSLDEQETLWRRAKDDEP